MDATTMVTAIIAILSVFGSSFGVIYLLVTARNRERLALIEKGQKASIFRRDPTPLSGLKWGLLAVCVGIGVFVGSIFGEIGLIDEPLAIASFSLMFGGVGLLLFYKLTKNNYAPSDKGVDYIEG